MQFPREAFSTGTPIGTSELPLVGLFGRYWNFQGDLLWRKSVAEGVLEIFKAWLSLSISF